LNRILSVDGATKGDGTVVWDGLDEAETMASGTCNSAWRLLMRPGRRSPATSYPYGVVSGIRFTSDGTVFVVDGMEIPLSQIIEILNGKGNG
jgi:hypothetical protein